MAEKPCHIDAGLKLFAETGGINIAYRVMGQGDPIVRIMGYSSTMDMLEPSFLDNLSSNFRIPGRERHEAILPALPIGLAVQAAGLLQVVPFAQRDITSG